MQQRESAKKAAASAAAANNSPSGRIIQGVPAAFLDGASPSQDIQQNVVVQTAAWLDRANAILRGTHSEGLNGSSRNIDMGQGQHSRHAYDNMLSSEIESQMKEVQRLINEGPLIQQTTAGLPNLLTQAEIPRNLQKSSTASPETMVSDGDPGYGEEPTSDEEPADKRMRTVQTSGAEDAEALVGFLRSVRASAASGQDL